MDDRLPNGRSGTGWGWKSADIIKDMKNGCVHISMNLLSGTNIFQTGESTIDLLLIPRGSSEYGYGDVEERECLLLGLNKAINNMID
jgi:hypothetical protein